MRIPNQNTDQELRREVFYNMTCLAKQHHISKCTLTSWYQRVVEATSHFQLLEATDEQTVQLTLDFVDHIADPKRVTDLSQYLATDPTAGIVSKDQASHHFELFVHIAGLGRQYYRKASFDPDHFTPSKCLVTAIRLDDSLSKAFAAALPQLTTS